MVAENGSEAGLPLRGPLLWVSILEDHRLLSGAGWASVCAAWPLRILSQRSVVHSQLLEDNTPGWLLWHPKNMRALFHFPVAGLS